MQADPIGQHDEDPAAATETVTSTALEAFLGIPIDRAIDLAVRHARALPGANHYLVEEMVQESFRRLATTCSNGARPVTSPTTYIARTVRSSFSDMLRQKERSLGEPGLDGLDPLSPLPQPDTTVVQLMETERFIREIQHLPKEEHRATVWAVCVDGLSVAEAARKLGIPRGTLTSRLKAAMKELRAQRRRLGDSGLER